MLLFGGWLQRRRHAVFLLTGAFFSFHHPAMVCSTTSTRAAFSSILENLPAYHDSPLHHTVAGRFELAEVVNYDVRQPYRPECLRKNQFVAYFWDADDLIAQFKDAAYEEAMRRVAASQNEPYEGHKASYWQAVANEITRRS
jgi:hypothetical protein